MYTHLTPFCYIVQISTVTASSTGPFPGAASAHPVAFLDARFSQAMRSPDFPACRPCGLRVRECLPVLDPPQRSASTDASTGSCIRSWIFGRPFANVVFSVIHCGSRIPWDNVPFPVVKGTVKVCISGMEY
ncbi:hypothetical protein MRX96_000131 [Rhipicephalus microplus]